MPNTCLDRIQAVLNKAAEGSNTQLRSVVQAVTTDEEPPTHFETNKFTACFQTIVEAYGVARYREVRRVVGGGGEDMLLVRRSVNLLRQCLPLLSILVPHAFVSPLSG